MRSVLSLLILICCENLFSQQDSVPFTNGMLKEGIYINYEAFRTNKPITKTEIQTKVKSEQLDFFGKVIDEINFTYTRAGQTYTADARAMWGFYQNNTLYINYKEVFYRVPVFGAICYLVAAVEVPVYYPGYYGPGGAVGSSVKTKEIREFIINFYNGQVEELNFETVETLLRRDEELYKEFNALSRKKKKDQVSRFIKRFNDKHIIYFLR